MASRTVFREPQKLLFYGFFCLLLWTLAACLCQGGWGEFKAFWWLFWKVSLVIIVLVAVYAEIRRGPTQALAVALMALAGIWLIYARSFASWKTAILDVLSLILAASITEVMLKQLARRFDPKAQDWDAVAPAHLKELGFVVTIPLAWSIISLVSVLTTSPLPTDPGRFARLGPGVSILPEHARRWNNLRIGLALSGGGYRAAVFHAGVLQALERLGIVVTHLSTVSGGSITGAYYAVGGFPAEIPEAVAQERFNLKRQLMLIHNAARLPFPMRIPGLEVELFPWYRFDRLDVQRTLLDDLLFAGSPLKGGLSDHEPTVGQPKLMIGATDLTYGFQLGFLPHALLKLGDLRGGPLSGRDFHPTHEFSLAERVAMSGAFPIAFPSRAMEGRYEGGSKRKFVLVDGGIRDNTGIELLRLGARFSAPAHTTLVPEFYMPSGWDLDAILYSDAGAVLEVVDKRLGPLTLLPRLFDISGIGKMTEAEVNSFRSYGNCREPIEAPAGFAPADFFVRPEEWYARGNDSPQPTNTWDFPFAPSSYPREIQNELLTLLPKPQQIVARATWKHYLELRRLHALKDSDFQAALNAASSSATKAPSIPGVPEALALQKIFRDIVFADLETFRGTSTLDATPDRATVNALERLGKMMVYLRWPLVKHKLEIARSCRANQVEEAHSTPPSIAR
jgi:predicted acylesterase/phospholipase RssA